MHSVGLEYSAVPSCARTRENCWQLVAYVALGSTVHKYQALLLRASCSATSAGVALIGVVAAETVVAETAAAAAAVAGDAMIATRTGARATVKRVRHHGVRRGRHHDVVSQTAATAVVEETEEE